MGLFSKAPAATPAASVATPEHGQDDTEQQLSLLVAGAPDTGAQERQVQRFLRSNHRHCYVDGALGGAAYTYSALQHMHGQSNALTLLSMWAAGTTFLVNVAMRKLVQEEVAPSPEFLRMQQQAQQRRGEAQAKAATVGDTTTTSSSTTPAAAVTPGGVPDLTAALRIISEKKAEVFQLETVASWIWMLSSLQQFRVHKRLKWCGYSSWSGLACSAYFTLRYMYGVLLE
ncbi:hypothetical protein STCU_07795 [Strigomonas culicis]|uniref:Uncharacterized protein n=1 Tax=Strigomonas culicis TaxID=28005 RepID=S9TW20_9TRYP|nr:hypothetical protein STCU_08833 [Strigomonas culicis]EPY23255.1 hypothetical protein STCU_07795 [Strigomonas culicis]|eukprot:EPY20794.1 hypothetical protein STCU_08833 [Strigomonas culicis]